MIGLIHLPAGVDEESGQQRCLICGKVLAEGGRSWQEGGRVLNMGNVWVDVSDNYEEVVDEGDGRDCTPADAESEEEDREGWTHNVIQDDE